MYDELRKAGAGWVANVKSAPQGLSAEVVARRGDARAQETHVAAGGDETKATFGERPCALTVVGIDAGDFPGLGRRLGDRGQRGVDLLGVRVDGFSVRKRNRQIEWADEDAVNAWRGQDGVEVLQRGAGFDHREDHREIVRLAQIDLRVRDLRERHR